MRHATLLALSVTVALLACKSTTSRVKSRELAKLSVGSATVVIRAVLHKRKTKGMKDPLGIKGRRKTWAIRVPVEVSRGDTELEFHVSGKHRATVVKDEKTGLEKVGSATVEHCIHRDAERVAYRVLDGAGTPLRDFVVLYLRGDLVLVTKATGSGTCRSVLEGSKTLDAFLAGAVKGKFVDACRWLATVGRDAETFDCIASTGRRISKRQRSALIARTAKDSKLQKRVIAELHKGYMSIYFQDLALEMFGQVPAARGKDAVVRWLERCENDVAACERASGRAISNFASARKDAALCDRMHAVAHTAIGSKSRSVAANMVCSTTECGSQPGVEKALRAGLWRSGGGSARSSKRCEPQALEHESHGCFDLTLVAANYFAKRCDAVAIREANARLDAPTGPIKLSDANTAAAFHLLAACDPDAYDRHLAKLSKQWGKFAHRRFGRVRSKAAHAGSASPK